jgi:hypothetical protein
MKVSVFSDSSAVPSCFAKVEKAKSFTVIYHPSAELKNQIKAVPSGSVIYADITGLQQPAMKKLLSLLGSSNTVFGILDPKGSVNDPAIFFHGGASDYIGKHLFRDGIDTSRINKAFEFGKTYITLQVPDPETAPVFSCPLSGPDWKNVVQGKDYTFCFMYIELDNQKEIKKRFTGGKLEEFTARFRSFIEKWVSDIHGRIWMWADLGGLVLFPFNGRDCPAIYCGFNLMLNRKIICFENFDYDMLLSFRIAIHIGDTTYRDRGETGEIVSDSINSIHHLKQYFAAPGIMYLTQEAYRFIPQVYQQFYVKAGNYEGREIYRLLNLL